MKVTGIIVLILVIFAAAVLAEVWRELHCFKITRYRIRTSKIKGDAGKVRIAFLSDLHNHVYGKENEELLLAIREAKPDLILAGGDMLVGKAGRDWTAAADLMKNLPQIAPVWCCNGNHEQRMHEQQEIYGKEYGYYENELKKAGIHVLVNGSEEIPVNGMKLRLYGMELPFGCYKKGWKVCPLTTGEMEERIGRDGRILHFNGTSSALRRNLLEVGSRPGAVRTFTWRDCQTSTAWRCDQSAVPSVSTLQRGLL